MALRAMQPDHVEQFVLPCLLHARRYDTYPGPLAINLVVFSARYIVFEFITKLRIIHTVALCGGHISRHVPLIPRCFDHGQASATDRPITVTFSQCLLLAELLRF